MSTNGKRQWSTSELGKPDIDHEKLSLVDIDHVENLSLVDVNHEKLSLVDVDQ